jgi:hypothetical protein
MLTAEDLCAQQWGYLNDAHRRRSMNARFEWVMNQCGHWSEWASYTPECRDLYARVGQQLEWEDQIHEQCVMDLSTYVPPQAPYPSEYIPASYGSEPPAQRDQRRDPLLAWGLLAGMVAVGASALYLTRKKRR